MAKVFLILLVGLVFESAGVVLLKRGVTQVGPPRQMDLPELVRVAKDGLASPQILLGVFFEALFFLCLLALMARSDISFLWPLTGLSFVFATLAAVVFLREHVSVVRWLGVVLIMLGAGLIAYSEKQTRPAAAELTAPRAAPGDRP